MGGFKKHVDRYFRKKSMSASSAVTSQEYFDTGLPTATLRTMYRTNMRSVLLYGTPLITDTSELESLDTKFLQN